MRKILLSAAALALATNAAAAADMPIKAPLATPAGDWSGFYLGVGIGIRDAKADDSMTSATLSGAAFPLQSGGCAGSGGCFTNEPLDHAALRGTIYAGRNWQIGPHGLVGLEADWGEANGAGKIAGMFDPWSFAGDNSSNATLALRTSWDASLRARVGWEFNPSTLVYATAGPTLAALRSISTCGGSGCGTVAPFVFPPATATDKTIRLGATVGGGVEAKVTANWIARAEYRYSDYGAASFTGEAVSSAGPFVLNHSVKLQTQTATFGLSYLFNGADHAGLVELLPSGTAMAPLPVKAAASSAGAANWSGPYTGAGFGLRDAKATDTVTSTIVGGVGPVGCIGAGCLTSEPVNQSGLRGEVFAGWAWQIGERAVVGAEGDWGAANTTTTLNGMDYPMSRNFLGYTSLNTDSFSLQTSWDASLRARAGWLVTPSLLVYATGGASLIELETNSTCSVTSGGPCAPGRLAPAVVIDRATRFGPTVGGGLEAKLTSNWIVRGEYRYADYGSIAFADTRYFTTASGLGPAGTPLTVSHSLSLRTQTMTLGLSYLWGG